MNFPAYCRKRKERVSKVACEHCFMTGRPVVGLLHSGCIKRNCEPLPENKGPQCAIDHVAALQAKYRAEGKLP